MRIRAALFLTTALLWGAPAFAQMPPGPPPNISPDPSVRRAFDELRGQMENIHRTERSQILAALTPAHRTLLAGIAGQLATSASPDYGAAAKRLDAALSTAESQLILRASQAARSQERSLMESVRGRFPGPMGPPPSARFGSPNATTQVVTGGFARDEDAHDAGLTVLRVMLSGPMGMRFVTRSTRLQR